MTTLSATRSASTYQPATKGPFGTLKQETASVSVTSNLTGGQSTIEFLRVPKGAVVVGGKFWGGKLEAASSGTLDIDIGYTGSTSGFGNFGILDCTAIAGNKAEATFFVYPLGGLLGTTGPQTFSAETLIKGTVVASATTFSQGTLNLMVEYYIP